MSALRRNVDVRRFVALRRALRLLVVTGALGTLVGGAGEVVVHPTSGTHEVAPASTPPPPTSAAPVQVSRSVGAADPVDVDRAVEEAKEAARRPRSVPDLSTMTLPQLQEHAVTMQAEFVRASQAYEAARTESELAAAEAAEALAASRRASAEAEAARSEFVATVNRTYQQGLSHNRVLTVLADPDSLDRVLNEHTTAAQVADVLTVTYDELSSAREKAELAAGHAEAMRRRAVEAEERAEILLDDIQGRAAKVAAAANRALAASAGGTTLFTDAEQEARNRAALTSWQRYLSALDKARVVPPAAAELADPGQLPRGLEPYLGADRTPVPGVASARLGSEPITVLPSETITAVSRAFAALGKPYVAGRAGPEAYDCAGLVSAVWESNGRRVPGSHPVDQYRSTREVPVEDAQVGDLVFFAEDSGVQHVGLNLGGELMLAADGSGLQVGVQPFPGTPFAMTRVTLPHREPNAAPPTDTESWTRCGSEELVSTGAGMVYPIKEGQYTISATFGQAGSLWSSGYNTGLDLAAPAGTPVLAAKGGTALVEESSWAGPNHVTIDHGNGLQTSYAHLKHALVETGDVVQPGALVGAVGSLGDAEEPHLHFEAIVAGTKVDPMLFLSGGSGPAGWGGFTNGMIPGSSMCPLTDAPGHLLRCDAAVAWNAMAAAFRHDLGTSLCVTDSYRSYGAQVATFAAKPDLAAIPGSSNHGWGLALDLCGGIERFGTPQHEWMVAHAPTFGWVHPSWARQGGSREEPWHWEYGSA